MSEEQNRLDELIQDREDINEQIAAAEARLRADGDEETPEVESPAIETPAPKNQTAIIAAIRKLEAEGKFNETGPLKAQLLEIQSGFSGLSPATPAAPKVPTLQELRQQIDAFEAKGDWTSSGALKAQIVQRTPVDGGH